MDLSNLTLPPKRDLLQAELEHLTAMLEGLDKEMLQATVRRESILSVREAIELSISRLDGSGDLPNSNQLEFDFGGDAEASTTVETTS